MSRPPGAPMAWELSVATGRVVAITYTLSTNDTVRHVRSELWGDRPFEYLHGARNIIPGLERALEGRLPGDHFSISIPPAEAYGERDRALQQRVPVDLLGGMDRLQPGMRFMATSEDGAHAETLLLTDVEEDEQMAVLDANHPLAGMTLQFEVSVVAVREATDEERARGRIISDESTDDAQAGAGALNIAPLVAVATQGQGG